MRHTVGLAFEDAKRVLGFLAPRSPGAVINLEILKSLSEAVADRRSHLDPSHGNCHVSKLFSSELLEPNARALERYATEEVWCQSDFFEDRTLVFRAKNRGLPCIVLVDGDSVTCQPCGTNRRPLGPKEAHWLHKGRKLLRAFNPSRS